jgi:hypothetical protein
MNSLRGPQKFSSTLHEQFVLREHNWVFVNSCKVNGPINVKYACIQSIEIRFYNDKISDFVFRTWIFNEILPVRNQDRVIPGFSTFG